MADPRYQRAVSEFCQRHPEHHSGVIASGDILVCSHEEREELRAPIPSLKCVEHEVPFSVVRIISDNADSGAHVDFRRFIQSAAALGSEMLVREFVRRIAQAPWTADLRLTSDPKNSRAETTVTLLLVTTFLHPPDERSLAWHLDTACVGLINPWTRMLERIRRRMPRGRLGSTSHEDEDKRLCKCREEMRGDLSMRCVRGRTAYIRSTYLEAGGSR